MHACAAHLSVPFTLRAAGASPMLPPTPRDTLRMGLPSKGRMAEDTQELMKDCALSVKKINPRQYVARIPQVRCWENTHSWLTLVCVISLPSWWCLEASFPLPQRLSRWKLTQQAAGVL
jgi:hypothetical protein